MHALRFKKSDEIGLICDYGNNNVMVLKTIDGKGPFQVFEVQSEILRDCLIYAMTNTKSSLVTFTANAGNQGCPKCKILS